MSAARVREEPHENQEAHEGRAMQTSLPAGRMADHLSVSEEGRHRSVASPARLLQSQLAGRLHRPRYVSMRATLATILVACLAMTFAAFVVVSSV